MKKRIILALLLLFNINFCYAWEATGHMLIANIAYKTVDKNIIDKLDALILVDSDDYPMTKTFVTASVWPDDIKKRGIKLYNNWHYQDIYFSADNTPLPPTQSDGQALEKLKRLKKILMSQDATKSEKAFALKMFIHIFGDMHQPLHNATRVSKDLLNGDLRGKLFMLDTEYTNLHSFWDHVFGLVDNNLVRPLNPTSEDWLNNYTQNLLIDYPPSSFTPEQITAKYSQWQLENVSLVKKKIYKNIVPNTSPSWDYIESNRAIIRQQLVLGGLRLANQLNCIFESEQCINQKVNIHLC